MTPEAEVAWIGWARIALKYEGVDSAMRVLGFALALHGVAE